jgi:hypothetical protein
MMKIRIDDIDYHVDSLSEHGRALVTSLQFVEAQLQRISNEIVVCRTARSEYVEELKTLLGHPGARQPAP